MKYASRYLVWLAPAILAMGVAGCGGGGDKSDGVQVVPEELAISPGARSLSLPLPLAVVGQPYDGKLSVQAFDSRNRVTGFQIANPTVGGALATIDSSGAIHWLPNDVDFLSTTSLRVTVSLASGPAEVIDVPFGVRKVRTVYQEALPAAAGSLADPDGRYLLRVEPEMTGIPMTGTLSLTETYAANGSFRFTIQVPESSNAKVQVLDAPQPLTVLPPLTASLTASDRKRALSTVGAGEGAGSRALGSPAPGLSEDIGASLGGDLLSGRRGQVADEKFNVVTTRFTPFYYALNLDGQRNTHSAIATRVFQVDGSCATKTACQPSERLGAPVILVHGFTPGGEIGGGTGTWGSVSSALIDRMHPVFELRWSTSMRFEEAAGVLATLARRVAEVTGNRPRIVAHSFGGIVAHLAAMGKGIRFDGTQWSPVPVDGVIDRIITLDSPLSGIATDPIGSIDGSTLSNETIKEITQGARTTLSGNFTFNLVGGRDSDDLTIPGCAAVTCFQAGSRAGRTPDGLQELLAKLSAIDAARIGFPLTAQDTTIEGGTIRSLHEAWAQGGGHVVPFATVVGIKWRPGDISSTSKTVADLGDGLISMIGQAVTPQDFAAAPFVPRSALALDLTTAGLGTNFLERLNASRPSNMLRVQVGGREYYFAPRAMHTPSHMRPGELVYPIAAYPEDGKVRISLLEAEEDHPLKHFIDHASQLAAPAVAYNLVAAVPSAIVHGRTLKRGLLDIFPAPTAVEISIQIENAVTGVAVTDRVSLLSDAGTGQFRFDAGRALADRFPNLSVNVSDFRFVVRAGGDLDTNKVVRRYTLAADTDAGDITVSKRDIEPLGTARGQVIDGRTEPAPVSGAAVFLMKGLGQRPELVVQVTDTTTSRRTLSDASGGFEVRDLEPGDYTVVARKSSYNSEAPAVGTAKVESSRTTTGLTLILTPPASASVPVVTNIGPTSMVANGMPQTLTINGSGFSTGNEVQFKSSVGSVAGVWVDASDAPSIGSNLITIMVNPGMLAGTINVRVCRSASQTAANDCSSGTAAIAVVLPGSPQITTVAALKGSFSGSSCRLVGKGNFSALAEYTACGPDAVGDFEFSFSGCVLKKSGSVVTLTRTTGVAKSMTRNLDKTFSTGNTFSGDAVEIGKPDPNYSFGSDESFNLLIGDFVGDSYAMIILKTNGKQIVSLGGYDFSSNDVFGCPN